MKNKQYFQSQLNKIDHEVSIDHGQLNPEQWKSPQFNNDEHPINLNELSDGGSARKIYE